MGKIFLTICLVIITFTSFAQRSVRVRGLVDTNEVNFKEIFYFWENYQNILQKKVFGNEVDINSFWADSDIRRYAFPDLRYEFIKVYPILSEYLIGIERRNNSLFEIKSVYYSLSTELDIFFIANVLVSKTSLGFKLINPLTQNINALNKKEYEWLLIYYPDNYPFDEEQTSQLLQRANKLAKDLNVKVETPIHYFLLNTYTDILNLLGIEIADDYFSSHVVNEKGLCFPQNRIIFYTNGGENHVHEIIHILIQDLRGNVVEADFDEGICVYFGDQVGLQPFAFHANRLKKFLNDNPQIDLGINLTGAYKNDLQKYTHDEKWKTDYGILKYHDDSTNFSYFIMGVLCEIAYKKGGMDLIRRMILEAPGQGVITTTVTVSANGEIGEDSLTHNADLYSFFENTIGIKKSEINIFIRDYLNKHY